MFKRLSVVLIPVAAGSFFALIGQTGEPPTVYTAAQAAAGRSGYEETCGKCHTPSLGGRKGDPSELPALSTLPADWQKVVQDAGGRVPPLAGADFMAIWGSRTTKDLSKRINEATLGGFPPKGANAETALDIAAYVLQANGARAGTQPLTAETAVPVQSVAGTVSGDRPRGAR
jgi:mono/diheme cytochrome c family protein